MTRLGFSGAVVSLSLVLMAAGCATNDDVSAARQEAADAKRVADEANAKASAAAADAAADSAAEEARKASEKADRIFQRSLHK